MKHFLLSSPQLPSSMCAHWCGAFPGGDMVDLVDLAHLKARLSADAPTATAVIVWINAASATWPDLLRSVRSLAPRVSVVLLSAQPDDEEGLRALQLGAQGYAHVYAAPALLNEVATVVAHGGLWVGAPLLSRLVRGTHQALARDEHTETQRASGANHHLTAREFQVARAVAEGRSNKEVAALLAISERTVKAHLGAIFEKLDVRDRLQLVLHLSMQDAAVATTKT